MRRVARKAPPKKKPRPLNLSREAVKRRERIEYNKILERGESKIERELRRHAADARKEYDGEHCTARARETARVKFQDAIGEYLWHCGWTFELFAPF